MEKTGTHVLTLTQKPNKKNLATLFIVAFLIRAATFQFFIQPYERYRQPDSMDYHNCAVSLALGYCMHRADTLEPIYWRAPGYPVYLSFFYNLFGIEKPTFSENHSAQLIALWLQILLSSLLPIFVFFLAYSMTAIPFIAWFTSWLFVFHLGPVLASGFFLTEALAILFFIPFLFFFYKSFSVSSKENIPWIRSIIFAGICLGIMTWIRPMGEFVSVVAAIIIFVLDRASWKIKFKKVGLLFLVFFAITGPWYLRNYRLTGNFFFCPMFGPYLNSFSAPKIVRDTTDLDLSQSIRALYNKAKTKAEQQEIIAYRNGKKSCKHRVALGVALPIILKHPFLFAYHWIKEILKTTFDLYSYQLVTFVKNCFSFDPLEEFLTEKWRECVYSQSMPIAMRLIVFLEIIFEILKWIGLLCGAWLFLLIPIFRRFNVSAYAQAMAAVWLKAVPMIGAFLVMTGGFGYARLRLPVEPLMIMLSLTFWYWLRNRRKIA